MYEGGFFIKNMDFPYNWGMNAKFKSFGHDAAVLKRQVIRMAGEWLERANLKRGRSNEDPIKHFEGIPDKYQPDFDPKVQFSDVALQKEMRTTPRTNNA